MLNGKVFGFVLVLLAISGLFYFKVLRAEESFSTSFDLDGDSKPDMFVKKSSFSLNELKIKTPELEVKYKNNNLEIKTNKGKTKLDLKSKEFVELENFRKIENKNLKVVGNKVKIEENNKTLLLLDPAEDSIYINSDADDKFDEKRERIDNDTISFSDVDEDERADIIGLVNNKIIYDIKNNTIILDLNKNGIEDFKFNLNTSKYEINYKELILFLGTDVVSIIKSGNFDPEVLENKIFKILKKKDKELYEFALKHKDDFLEFLNYLKTKTDIKPIIPEQDISKPKQTINEYYRAICNKEDVSWLFSPILDIDLIKELHSALYDAYTYKNCKVLNISCKPIEVNVENRILNYTECKYEFRAEIVDKKGKKIKVDRNLTTLLDDNFLIVWTRGEEE